MSNTQSSEVSPDLAASSVAKPERMLAGFPWVSAIVLYTLSWGWSLLRPNTLYWDDWSLSLADHPMEIWSSRKNAGLAPWVRLFDWMLLEIGIWPIRFLTFGFFFGVTLLIYKLLQIGIEFISSTTQGHLALLLMVIPVNHARISVIVFDYTTSYFLFYLGWFVLVRYKSEKSFVLACVFLFLSFKTHSFLFFILLPFLHFGWLNRARLLNLNNLRLAYLKMLVIATLPVLYVVLRSVFWPPSVSWQDYQKPTTAGVLTGLWPVLIGLVGLSIIGMRRFKKKRTHVGLTLLIVGFSITALALFPYFAGELYVGYAGRPAYVTVFEFRADWRSRHQLLMPLGLALSVVGLNELFKWKKRNLFLSIILVVSVGLNMFWGSQYFLQSLKQEQLVDLFKSTKGNLVVASVSDSTLRFNGRENDFRGYEWNGFMTLAGIATDRPGCEALPNGSVLNLKSDKPYLKALFSRELDLYFDVTPCTELLAQNG